MLLKRLFGRRPDNPLATPPEASLASALASPDVTVRREACRTLNDLRQLRGLADGDEDAGVRELAEARYRRLLCGLDATAPVLAERIAELEHTTDQTLIAHTALQASDAPLRRAAIDRLEDSKTLVRCATADEVAANRLAAAERVHRREELEQIVKASSKRDKGVYRLARDRLKQLTEQEERPRRARALGETLCERLERLGRFDNWLQDRAVLEHLEQQWREIEPAIDAPLRERFQSLRERFLAGYQQAQAAQTAEQEARTQAELERGALIEQLKQLSARAADLDHNALEQEARWLSRARHRLSAVKGGDDADLEAVYRHAEQALAARQEQLQTGREQAQAAARLLEDLRRQSEHGGTPERRHLNALRKRRQALVEVATASAQASPCEPAHQPANASQASSASQHGTPAPAAGSLLTEIDQLLDRLTRRLARHQKQIERKLSTLPARLDELEAHLHAGELKKADPLYQSISATLEQARSAELGREAVAAADARFKAIAPQLRELRHWRRWSSDEHRALLCAEIEELAADTQHPDEQSVNRLQELKEQWQQLDRQGAPADAARWQRFRAAADRIRERCKPYLEAQAALRSENRKQREALAARLEEFLAKVDWERVEWKKLSRAAREMRQAWASLSTAPGADAQGARERAIEGRFRRALRRLERALAEERARNQAEKHQLIEQMQALAEEPDLRRAVDQAKQLQHQWHTTVPARHRDENTLWQQFRAASDAVFARRDAEYEARGASLRANQEMREGICRDLLALAESASTPSSAELEQQLSALKRRWHDTEALPLPRQAQAPLQQRWREALASAQARLAAQREGERWAGLDCLARRADYCDSAARRLATGAPGADDCAALRRGWEALPAVEDAQLAEMLSTRFDQVLAACSDPQQREALASLLDDNLRKRESLCLDLEIIAQIDSPEELREARMQRQVERLRDRMGEGEHEAADITERLQDWYLTSPAAASCMLDTRFERIKAALRDEASSPQTDSTLL